MEPDPEQELRAALLQQLLAGQSAPIAPVPAHEPATPQIRQRAPRQLPVIQPQPVAAHEPSPIHQDYLRRLVAQQTGPWIGPEPMIVPGKVSEADVRGLEDLMMGIGPASLDAPGALPKLFHGTQKAIETFDPSHVGEGLLPTMVHFAENPTYASLYATGKHGGGPNTAGVFVSNVKEPTAASLRGARPNIIAAVPEAKHVFDFTKPVSAADEAIISKAFGTDQWSLNMLMDALDDPAFQAKLPYDAYRYEAHGQMNWAIPHTTPIKTPQGVPLTRGK